MRVIIGLVIASTLATGCTTNTVFDDNAYRSVGNSAPRAEPITVPIQGSDNELLSGIGIEKPKQGGHLVRYGHPNIIPKIIQTARIHCQPFTSTIQTNDQSYWGEHQGQLQQCTYQFPDHCGAHRFTVINYAEKLALAYLEHNSDHYVIDLIQGSPNAKPGLWDTDDRIGSTANNMGYILENNYNTNYNTNYQLQQSAPLHLGWIIQASLDDEAAHGKRYHQAITDIVECF